MTSNKTPEEMRGLVERLLSQDSLSDLIAAGQQAAQALTDLLEENEGLRASQTSPVGQGNPALATRIAALTDKIEEAIDLADIAVTYDSVGRRYTHIQNTADITAAILRFVADGVGRVPRPPVIEGDGSRDTASLLLRAETAEREREWRPTHRHVKRGSLYRLVSSAVLQTEAPVGDNEFLALYQGEDGLYWVRPADEFKDGRFEALAVSTALLGEGDQS